MKRYETLMNKAMQCIENSKRADSEWARDFWHSVAIRLENKANDLTVGEADEENN